MAESLILRSHPSDPPTLRIEMRRGAVVDPSLPPLEPARAQDSRGYRAAFLTLPLRRQRVQTFIRWTFVPSFTRTRCRFGIQRRLETLCAWLMRFPNTGVLPQTSHFLAMFRAPK